MGRVDGKVALISGGAQGMGAADARALVAEGAKVVIGDILDDKGKALADEIGEAARYVHLDVTQAEEWDAAVATAVNEFGKLNVLVNNAGTVALGQIGQFDMTKWQKVIDVNLTGTFLGMQASVEAMKADGGGSIINISSIAGIRAHGSIAYGPSKAAMAALAREITVTYGRRGIRANTVAPGHVMTPLAMSSQADMRAKRRNVGPLGAEGDAWDVALAVRYLASDEARFVTGVHLPVDGGVTEIGPLAAHALIESGSGEE